MSRWQPDSRHRLQDAALELYLEQGFAATTVAAVAERAGLTERTFFRHFADKREVLFANEDALRERLVDAVREAPAEAGLRALVAAGLGAVVDELQPRRDELRRREPVIASQPELRERELMKLASWTEALEGALRDRGAAPGDAQLSAQSAIGVLSVAAQRWMVASGDELLAAFVERVDAELRALLGSA